MKSKKLFLLIFTFYAFYQFGYSQSTDEKRMKIEICVKSGNEKICTALQSVTLSFTRPAASDSQQVGTANPETSRIYYLAIYLDRQSMPLLKALVQNKNGVEGTISMTDTYGKLPAREITFRSAVIDSFNDQFVNDYPGNSYMTLRCAKIIIDGLKIEQ